MALRDLVDLPPGGNPRTLAWAAQLRRDPLALMAELAGYTDSENWWDATLERGHDDSLAVFEALLGMVGEQEVRSLFDGVLQSFISVDGERLTAHQPIAWLRTI